MYVILGDIPPAISCVTYLPLPVLSYFLHILSSCRNIKYAYITQYHIYTSKLHKITYVYVCMCVYAVCISIHKRTLTMLHHCATYSKNTPILSALHTIFLGSSFYSVSSLSLSLSHTLFFCFSLSLSLSFSVSLSLSFCLFLSGSLSLSLCLSLSLSLY